MSSWGEALGALMGKHTYQARNILLREMGYSNYAEYLESDLWAGIKRRAFEELGRLCLICNGGAEVLHHISYGKEVMQGKTLAPLAPLCHGCHHEVEFDAAGKKRTLAQAHTQYRRMLRGGKKRCVTEDGKRSQVPTFPQPSCYREWLAIMREQPRRCKRCGTRTKKCTSCYTCPRTSVEPKDGEVIMTFRILQFGSSKGGGWTAEQAKLFGYELFKGWVKYVIGYVYPESVVEEFLQKRKGRPARLEGVWRLPRCMDEAELEARDARRKARRLRKAHKFMRSYSVRVERDRPVSCTCPHHKYRQVDLELAS